ncbi:DUF6292 family protein [Actinokineospora diospyrosa]|uniref:DUF6292 domain-containing protein n=1 Tax=Actinokineospora diospyrosa TaxID=103728 RepID=A0ABT1IIQ6_9PSEU|nr:DUF6292 family protein [Actinokineospora diospyrosa]MCP2272535.1 hypothetical protein [Actinokineospora diospyrosa]
MTRTDAHRHPRTTTATRAGAPTQRGKGSAPAPPTEVAHPLGSALVGYVSAVAELLGVPEDGVTCEVTDTVTAYLALGCRAEAHPDRDVMLVWDARGWSVLVETDPTEPPIVLSPPDGDLVPDPAEVARLVTVAVARRAPRTTVSPTPHPVDWSDVVDRMRRHG